MKTRIAFILPALIIIVAGYFCLFNSFGCTSSSGGSSNPLVGNWRILTETVYWDTGSTATITPVSTLLVLNANATWQFGSSSGTWSTASIEASDWTDWGIAAYGPTRKLILNNWNNTTEKGPIDETGSTINNIWIIYRTTSDQNGDGTIWMKLGRQ